MSSAQKFIWRIEDPDGFGPYRGRVKSYGFGDPYSKRNPSPIFDKLKDDPSKTVAEAHAALPENVLRHNPALFGFSTPGQMKRWFHDPRIIKNERWGDYGYKIAVLCRADMRAVIEGQHQTEVLVKPRVRHATIPLDHLWTKSAVELQKEAKQVLTPA